MLFNMKVLKQVYEEAIAKGTICYVNEDKDPDEEEITFDEFKEYIVKMIISNLQYDLNITGDLYNLITEVDE